MSNLKENLFKLLPIVERYSLAINIILIIVGLIGLFMFVLDNFIPSSLGVAVASPEEAYAQNTEEQERKFIDIAGEVVNPGVYEILRGDILINVIENSGGFTNFADLFYVQKCINLAEKLKDEQKIYVPAKSEFYSCEDYSIKDESNFGSSQKLVSLNNASKVDLESLPGIGPATADKIIENRPYSSIDELKDIGGIGDATFEKLQPLVSL